ncbi:MAG: mechanosensitive ion channel [Acidobacteria bacterium]|nr:mechanosensitive ion channel [Acidobacteriota bacterium]
MKRRPPGRVGTIKSMQWLSRIPLDRLPGPEYFLALGASLLRVAVIVMAAVIFTRLLRKGAFALKERFERRQLSRPDASNAELAKRMTTLMRFVRVTIGVVVWSMAVVMSLKELGYDVGPLIAGAGVVGLAVGFGAQNLVRDVINGLFLLMEDQIRVGDIAEINGKGGLVEEINLRTIVLRDLEGAVHIFPNGAITSTTNKTRGYSCYVFDVGVAYKEDTDQVVELLKAISDEMQAEPDFQTKMLGPLEIFGVDKFADSAVIIKARVRTIPLQQFAVGREMNRRIKKLFDEKGIEIPFPHRTIYYGDKPGAGLSAEDREAIREIVREEVARAGKAEA